MAKTKKEVTEVKEVTQKENVETSAEETNIEGTEATTKTEAKAPVILIVGAGTSSALQALSIVQWEKFMPEHKVIPVMQHEDYADIRLAEILLEALESKEVPAKIIVSPIETFPVNEISEDDLTGLFCLKNSLKVQDLTCLKNVSELACTQQLKKAGWTDVYNYETKLPVMLEKEKLQEIFEKFAPEKYPTKIISLYLNFFNRDKKPEPVQFGIGGFATGVWRSNPRMEIVQKAISEGKFLLVNNDGYEAVKDFFVAAETEE